MTCQGGGEKNRKMIFFYDKAYNLLCPFHVLFPDNVFAFVVIIDGIGYIQHIQT